MRIYGVCTGDELSPPKPRDYPTFPTRNSVFSSECQMALWTKRKEAIRIPVCEFVKNLFALSDVEPLTLKLFDECIPNLTNCAVWVLLALRGRDHLPKQHPCEIVPARRRRTLASSRTFCWRSACSAFRCFFDFLAITLLLCQRGASSCRSTMQATNSVFATPRRPPCRMGRPLQTPFSRNRISVTVSEHSESR